MRIVAMVPIKLDSERVKEKNIRLFYDGKPLLQFILESIKKSKYIKDIFVYCSNERIIRYLPQGVHYLKRPEYLDSNDCNCNDIIREFIKVVDSDLYAVCHATAPFTKHESIDRCVEAVLNSDYYDSAFTVERIQSFLWRNEKPINFDIDTFPRTQDLEPIYRETSGAFVFPKWVFEQYNRRVGKKPCLVEVEPVESPDIDTEYDMTIAQIYYRYIQENNNN